VSFGECWSCGFILFTMKPFERLRILPLSGETYTGEVGGYAKFSQWSCDAGTKDKYSLQDLTRSGLRNQPVVSKTPLPVHA